MDDVLARNIKMQFLGSGTAFTVGYDNYQSNVLLSDEADDHLLIDCGTDARLSLAEAGFSYQDVDNVYLSHLHTDHAGGLEWLGLTRYFDDNPSRPRLFASNQLIDCLWQHGLAAGMSTLKEQQATLDDFFVVHGVEPQQSFSWSNIEFTLIPVEHYYSNKKVMPCCGLFFKINETQVFYTADVQFIPHKLADYYQQADIIFHDCETSEERTGIHPHYEDLCSLPAAIRKKMWLYHYQGDGVDHAVDDGFAGFVKKGQIFTFDKEKA